MTESTLPLRVENDARYYRIQYHFCPQSISTTTVARTMNRDEEDSDVAWVSHTLQNGETCKFKGKWSDAGENFKECVFVICDGEAKLLPLSSSITNLKKASN